MTAPAILTLIKGSVLPLQKVVLWRSAPAFSANCCLWPCCWWHVWLDYVIAVRVIDMNRDGQCERTSHSHSHFRQCPSFTDSIPLPECSSFLCLLLCFGHVVEVCMVRLHYHSQIVCTPAILTLIKGSVLPLQKVVLWRSAPAFSANCCLWPCWWWHVWLDYITAVRVIETNRDC